MISSVGYEVRIMKVIDRQQKLGWERMVSNKKEKRQTSNVQICGNQKFDVNAKQAFYNLVNHETFL